MVVQGDDEWDTIRDYVEFVAPDLAPRLSKHDGTDDVFAAYRIDEQLAKALDRKVWLPSGGSLVIDRTEAMVVVDVNTGKYVGKGGNLEETVTRNNLEAAEEIARQLRLRDLGGIIVVDFIDMVLESNRDLVVRRLVECLGRDRTKHQVAEVTSLGLVQMTRKRVGQGLLEAFSETCEACNGRGVKVHSEPVDEKKQAKAERFDDASAQRARRPRPRRPWRRRKPRDDKPRGDKPRDDKPREATTGRVVRGRGSPGPKKRSRGGRGRGGRGRGALAVGRGRRRARRGPPIHRRLPLSTALASPVVLDRVPVPGGSRPSIWRAPDPDVRGPAVPGLGGTRSLDATRPPGRSAAAAPTSRPAGPPP